MAVQGFCRSTRHQTTIGVNNPAHPRGPGRRNNTPEFASPNGQLTRQEGPRRNKRHIGSSTCGPLWQSGVCESVPRHKRPARPRSHATVPVPVCTVYDRTAHLRVANARWPYDTPNEYRPRRRPHEVMGDPSMKTGRCGNVLDSFRLTLVREKQYVNKMFTNCNR